MANRIKGLTVDIDGSTTGLDKALKAEEKENCGLIRRRTALHDPRQHPDPWSGRTAVEETDNFLT